MISNIFKTWDNGASGKVVREAIEYNFDLLYTRLNERVFSKSFVSSDWIDGVIRINYSEHRISSPSPHVLMLHDGNYIDVQGGVYIDSSDNIRLETDIPYDGRVVIK